MGASDDWNIREFVDPRSGARTIVRKCIRPAVDPGDGRFANVAYLTFKFQPRDQTGLPARHDSDALFRIEREEISRLEADGLALLVAVVSDAGVKDFLFYTGAPERFLREAGAIRDAHPEFEMGCEVGPDAGWAHYKDLP